ncbi:GntR family transcriptional regulator [Lactobacillus colini]|uniref:GntR family transcriptional regulator n=1 Tax=Lactobacillus colini TaxID=1819254 RepID=A0ABS4MCQ8_9LACO|nr:GntR family transcriptional regulator [Lactobacillus colini]MBP2057184.1 GntR family transcriptional regulator [Lactobacillus colini]
MSKYLDIAADIERDIISKKYTDKLPRETDLAKKYQTSRVVISRALKVLSVKNMIYVVQGSGIYVKKRDIQFPHMVETAANKHDGFVNSMTGKGNITSHVISFFVRTAESEEAEKLKLKSDDQVYDIIRQRLVNGQPAKLEYTIMPVKVIPGITLEILHGSVYNYIRDELHLDIGRANRIIVADKVDAYDCDYLGCKAGDAILSVHQVAFLKDGTPFEFSETRDRYDRAGYILFEVNN